MTNKGEKAPIIGIIMDENSSKGGDHYDMSKAYFNAVAGAGGVPIGLPYNVGVDDFAIAHCDGLISSGARIAFPKSYYGYGPFSNAPFSERMDIELSLIAAFLDLDRPYLGICHGMQALCGLSGGQLHPSLKVHVGPNNSHITHDGPLKDGHPATHDILIEPNSRLALMLAHNGGSVAGSAHQFLVNSYHQETVVALGPNLAIGAKSADGVIEAIERTDRHFAFGIQWHPERIAAPHQKWMGQDRFAAQDVAMAKALFSGLVQAAARGRLNQA